MFSATSESDTITRIRLDDREIVLVGTAHVSRDSVDQVREIIQTELPDTVCVEIDHSRYQTLSQKNRWQSLDIAQVLKQGRGFLLLVNLVLSSFQRRLGADLGVSPGEEMLAAVNAAKERGIPFVLCDREIQTTLRRAWSQTGFWGKNKLLAALLSAGFSREKFSEDEIEKLKEKSELHGMMEELADFLPQAKHVLIDERDQFLATKVFQAPGSRIVAVVGAGHVPGMLRWLEDLKTGQAADSLDEINSVPPRTRISKILPYVIPVLVITLIGLGFYRSGFAGGMSGLYRWIVVNGTLSGVGAIAALAHPLTILLSVLAAPITSMNPTIGVGMVAGLIEAVFRKPRVEDFERLTEDALSLRGFYRNRITRVLLVFLFTSIGSSIGTFIAIPLLFPAAVG
ncbi:TraB/GumN family protein [Spirochaeta africana]|uniref:Pheromone shutdown-related protein TraB n=1 Tax=Spirochaeta africana (strain ATCC 700263 / DSM 8902 / Z-7692) TaxID=889378 RepID=H9UMN2_SPIAZ|nr:TraB/GumN family protein [Spirochaeta africana]AFG38775.1 pheromone shutdown-related protein TraB [Spirochaeta africana DSM 8902]